MMKKFSLLTSIILLAFTHTTFSQMPPNPPEDEAKPEIYILTSNKVPEGYPLKLKETHGGNIGVIYDYHHKPFVYTLKNISDKPVKNITVKSTCHCITLDSPIENRTLAPDEELPVNFTISGANINIGKFDRMILVIVEGFPNVRLAVMGENTALIDFDPAVCINLGEFHGFTPFKRTFIIKTRLDDDKLQLGQPEENQYFDTKFTKTAPQTYTLEVSSKKRQFPIGRIGEKILIPATGVEHYGPVFVGLKGRVYPPRFRFEKSKITIEPQDIPQNGPYKTSFEVKLLSLPKLRQISMQSSSNLVAPQPVSIEENQQTDILNKIETWQLFANDMTFVGIPDGVTVEKIPRSNGLDIQLTISENYLKTMTSFSFYGKYGYGKYSIFRIGNVLCTKKEQ